MKDSAFGQDPVMHLAWRSNNIMRLINYSDIESFIEDALPVLLEKEVENNLILGIALTLKNDPAIYPEKYLAAVRNNGKIEALAVCTPPHKLLLYSRDEHAAEQYKLVAENILKSQMIPGVLASKNCALNFAKTWQYMTGENFEPGMSEKIYKLGNVSFPPKVEGTMGFAQEKDFDLICEWVKAFHQEAIPDDPLNHIETFAKRKIEKGEIALWETDKPVSVVAKARSTINGICVNMVYTPPEHRNKGYASQLVATFSQSLLDEGWKFCTLFTDLTNPVSNSIYQRIGYRPVCDFQEYNFKR